MEERKIIFVCTGNTCRSPMAEAVLRSEIRRLHIENVSVFSAGLETAKNGNIHPNSAAVLSENGLSLENFNSRTLDGEMLRESYAIVCMTDSQRDIVMDFRWEALRKAGFSEIENNVYSFSDIAGYQIPDPFGKEMDCYRLTFQKIAEGMSLLIVKFFPELGKEKDKEIVSSAAAADKEAVPVKRRKPRAKPRKRVGQKSETEKKAQATSKNKTKKPAKGASVKGAAKKPTMKKPPAKKPQNGEKKTASDAQKADKKA